MARKRKPWQERWIRIDKDSESGGQGVVCLVKEVASEDSGERFALKELINHKCMERRERMYREVAALQTLKHPGIPKFLDFERQSVC